ncbi:MAG TPA: DUF3108 domain-containing protein [Leptospiraceae bacterium]|nr:DUF3108 domain-containing protein [Leptospiraceae bacterium]HMX33410.1 DUF3108 domain-containing protein [Leptospiraceae bacterium]HMY30340.1 DUF3108 domain-containing protein [Leptospiraceae bacterium]HMZ65136.1 DUF3108 domain-containing protein [Leptospiraceae bacterium]HNA07127.1 DUF3108 domain-containing protein [Leptospiraceae bacterium]
MKKVILILFCISLSLHAEAFTVGEVLKYNISLWGITVGYSTMSVSGKTLVNGEECFIFETKAEGTPFINRIFKVDDRIKSIWNIPRKLPVYSEKKLHEGFYKRNHSIVFDLKKKTAHWEQNQFSGNTDKAGVQKQGAKWVEKEGDYANLPSEFQDILSAIYYQREYKAQVEVGKSFSISLFDDLKLTEMKIQILREEKLELKINGEEKEIDTIVVQPFIKTTGIFRSKGNIYIWISNDSKRMPVKITADIPFAGHVTVLLKEVI